MVTFWIHSKTQFTIPGGISASRSLCVNVGCWPVISLRSRIWSLPLATATIALSWAAVQTTFALHYAHDYYRGSKPGGLQFPSGEERHHADYWDFVYFSFVIGMTAQAPTSASPTRHPPQRHRARHRLLPLQHRAARADGQHRGERDLGVRLRIFASCFRNTVPPGRTADASAADAYLTQVNVPHMDMCS